MQEMTTQLITAISLTWDKGLVKERQYLFSFQVSDKNVIRIVTTDDVAIYYASVHDFLISWSKITSLGWANDKETFQKMLAELRGNA